MNLKKSVLAITPAGCGFWTGDRESFSCLSGDPSLPDRLAGKRFGIVVDHPEIRFKTWTFPAGQSSAALRKMAYWKLKAEYGGDFDFFFSVRPAGKSGTQLDAGVLFFRNERLAALIADLSRRGCVIDFLEIGQVRLAVDLVRRSGASVMSVHFDSSDGKRIEARFEAGDLTAFGPPDPSPRNDGLHVVVESGIVKTGEFEGSSLSDPRLPPSGWDFLPDRFGSLSTAKKRERLLVLSLAGLAVWLLTASLLAIFTSFSLHRSIGKIAELGRGNPAIASALSEWTLAESRLARVDGLTAMCVDWPSRAASITAFAGPSVRFVEFKCLSADRRLELAVRLDRIEDAPPFVDRLNRLEFLRDVRIAGSTVDSPGYTCRIEGAFR